MSHTPTSSSRPTLRSRRFAAPLRLLAMLIVLVIIGMLFRDVAYGRLFILAYGVFAIVCAVPSSHTFLMALVAVAAVPILSVSKGIDMAQAFAQYAFLLIAIGIASMWIENYRHDRKVLGVIKKTPKRSLDSAIDRGRYLRKIQ